MGWWEAPSCFPKIPPRGVFQTREMCSEKETESKTNKQVSVEAWESAWEKPHTSFGNVSHPWSLERTGAMPSVQTWLTPQMSLGEVGMGQEELSWELVDLGETIQCAEPKRSETTSCRWTNPGCLLGALASTPDPQVPSPPLAEANSFLLSVSFYLYIFSYTIFSWNVLHPTPCRHLPSSHFCMDLVWRAGTHWKPPSTPQAVFPSLFPVWPLASHQTLFPNDDFYVYLLLRIWIF